MQLDARRSAIEDILIQLLRIFGLLELVEPFLELCSKSLAVRRFRHDLFVADAQQHGKHGHWGSVALELLPDLLELVLVLGVLRRLHSISLGPSALPTLLELREGCLNLPVLHAQLLIDHAIDKAGLGN